MNTVRFGGIYSVGIHGHKPGGLAETAEWLRRRAAERDMPISVYSADGAHLDVFTAEDAPLGKPMETYQEDLTSYDGRKEALVRQLDTRRSELNREARRALFAQTAPDFREALESPESEALFAASERLLQMEAERAEVIEADLTADFVQWEKENHPQIRYKKAMEAITGAMAEGRYRHLLSSEIYLWDTRGRFDIERGRFIHREPLKKLGRKLEQSLLRPALALASRLRDKFSPRNN